MSPEAGFFLVNEVAPRIYKSVPHRVKGYGAEDAEELCQDGITIAAQMIDRLEQSGKTVSAGNVAFYALKHLQSGRRSTGTSVTDIFAPAAQQQCRASLESLNEPLGSEEDGGAEFLDLLACEQDDPAVCAARNLDWEAFMGTRSTRERRVIQTLAEGGELQKLAREMGASPSSLSADKQRLTRCIKEAWGNEVLHEVGAAPGWRTSIEVGREKRRVRAAGRG